ncbi:hypothetical protein HU200_043535 [Digitaria exilis]|uniref:Uncharacterized protein n=1 Tax=Digitaria exilis TaxID=1010633 RepID=A0A835EG88_9POAL|nr:hypothetical protein HU200_043535 [Digitaria exilis]
MEDYRPRRRSAASRRVRYLLALAGDYLKYLFMKRRRLMHKVARRTLALVHRHHLGGERSKSGHHHQWSRALMEREFSCADSPSPAFLAAKRLLLRYRLRGGAATGAVSSCFGSLRRAPCGSPAETAAAPSEAEEVVEVEEEEHQLETTEDDEEEEDDEVVVAEERWAQCGELLDDVDDRAEEFINMFYEQLRAQSFAAVFQCSP